MSLRPRGLLGLLLLLAGCEAPVPLELQPDSLLQATLGLTARDVVHRVYVRVEGTAERARPARVAIQPGHWVSFRGGDARGHVVRFDTLGLSPEARGWLRESAQVESPPLLTPASRWVVTFRNAPPGDYPFVIEGTGAAGEGRIDVRAER